MNAMFCIIKLAVFDNHTSVALVQWQNGSHGVVLWENRHPAAPRTAFEWRTIGPLIKHDAHEEFKMLALAVLHDEHIAYVTSRRRKANARYIQNTDYESWLTILEDGQMVMA